MHVPELLVVLALAALPALGNAAGGLAAEVVRPSPRSLSLALHLAAGIVLGVVGLELMPTALDATHPWVSILAFTAGGGAFLALRRLVRVCQDRVPGGAGLTIWAGVAIDLLSDGVLIGTGTLIDPRLGLLLALGQVPADLPEGFAAAATLRTEGVPRRRRVLLSAAFAVPVLLGATVGYLALRPAPELATLAVLALTGGVLTAVAVEDMIEEAHEHPHASADVLALVAGFSLFAAVSTYVG